MEHMFCHHIMIGVIYVYDLTTLLRRRVNATILFIHSIISSKFISPHLRDQMDLNLGTRTLRNPELICLRFGRTEHSTWSCRMYNHAALFIDPTLSHTQIRKRLLKLASYHFWPMDEAWMSCSSENMIVILTVIEFQYTKMFDTQYTYIYL